MNIIACIDNENGILFNSRRQSRDAKVFEDIKSTIDAKIIYCSEYSAKLLQEYSFSTAVVKTLKAVPKNGYYFLEDSLPSEFLSKIKRIIIYKWNKTYPKDTYFGMELSKIKPLSTTEFEGKSHKIITKEIYEL